MNNLQISVIILNYQSWAKLELCLHGLEESHSLDLIKEIIVVDNASPTDLIIEFQTKFPNVKFVRNSGNNGFANGCNRGAVEASGNAYLFLNPDTIPNTDAIKELKTVKELFNQIAILSCSQTNDNGIPVGSGGQFKSIYTIWGWLRSIRRRIIKPDNRCSFSDKLERRDWVSGSVILIGKELFDKIGGWCEDYWMYSEDDDLCRRASINDKGVYILKKPTIVHSHGGSSRINIKVAAMTKSEVKISRHVYFSKYETGIKLFIIHLSLILKTIFELCFLSIVSIPLFFMPKIRLYPVLFKNMLQYYFLALQRRSWLSPRIHNTRKNPF